MLFGQIIALVKCKKLKSPNGGNKQFVKMTKLFYSLVKTIGSEHVLMGLFLVGTQVKA